MSTRDFSNSERRRSLLYIIYFSALPVLLMRDFWRQVFISGAVRAWDGTGHFAVAQIYDQSIFPDTFGWTNAYYGGMPLPNFYPPLMYWCTALIHHSHLFSFTTSFKIMLAIPMLAIPAVIWLLSRYVSEKNLAVTILATSVSLFPLLDSALNGNAIWASGLDYFSTFQIGLYSQPLGFVLLILWYIVYSSAGRGTRNIVLSILLLSLTVLANFFNAVIAAIIIGAVITVDLVRLVPLRKSAEVRESYLVILKHVITPAISVGLALFWLLPMWNQYDYFVTRPFTLVFITPYMWVWYVIAAAGVLCWLRKPTTEMYSYIIICAALISILVLSKTVTLSWFPLQAVRFSNMLNYLLVIPVGYAISAFLEKLKNRLLRLPFSFGTKVERTQRYIPAVYLVLLALAIYGNSKINDTSIFIRSLGMRSFYPVDSAGGDIAMIPVGHSSTGNGSSSSLSEERTLDRLYRYKGDYGSAEGAAALEGILRFGRDHKDGRYLVEFSSRDSFDTVAYDGRAITSFLGAQGNESLVVVFREASPSAIFMNPQVGAFSTTTDGFGISSVLSDDFDFSKQPLDKHLERALQLGVRYLVINTDSGKERLAKEPLIGSRRDFGDWSIFEIRHEPVPKAQVLSFRPALLVSDLSVKMRRRDDTNFIRFAEEQFTDGWFDVPLVRSVDRFIDRMGDLETLNRFGAIVLDSYDCADCDLALRRLRLFAQNRPLVLLASHNPLFYRIRSEISQFPKAAIIERNLGNEGEWIQNIYGPTYHYSESPIRSQWSQIRSLLEKYKVPVDFVPLEYDIGQNTITARCVDKPAGYSVPVLVRTSYHPNWQRGDGDRIYDASPTFMLTFIDQSASLTFKRTLTEKLSLLVSAAVLLGLVCFALWPQYYRLFSRVRKKNSIQPAQVLTSSSISTD